MFGFCKTQKPDTLNFLHSDLHGEHFYDINFAFIPKKKQFFASIERKFFYIIRDIDCGLDAQIRSARDFFAY